MDKNGVKELLPQRKKFTHKGTYGHLLVCSGNENTRGASLLTAKAALKTGAGLITLLTNTEFFPFVNLFSPELMTRDMDQMNKLNLEKFTALAIGPGLGTSEKARERVLYFLSQNKPLVLDADALNVLRIEDLMQNSNNTLVITPHVNEFDRLFGKHSSWHERLQTAKEFAKEKKTVIVLKNKYTYIYARLRVKYLLIQQEIPQWLKEEWVTY